MLHFNGLWGFGVLFVFFSRSECYSDGPILVQVIGLGSRHSGQNREDPAWQSRILRSSDVMRKCSVPQSAQVHSRQSTCLSQTPFPGVNKLISGSGLQGKWCVCHKFESLRIRLAEFENSCQDCSCQFCKIWFLIHHIAENVFYFIAGVFLFVCLVCFVFALYLLNMS